jgi:carboxypeptidase C (cathepsin A)
MKSILRGHAALLLLALAGCGGGGGPGSSVTVIPPPGGATLVYTDSNVYSSSANASLQTPNEITSVTQGTVTAGGQPIAYTATTGHLTARHLGTDEADASIFYIAYTANGRDPATRPVTFFYNGGPGSATVWLHMGSYGPKRLDVQAPSQDIATPFALVENTESMLDVSDLVFVDAVGSGFSQAISPNRNQTFWGVDADAGVFRDFIRRYVAVNNRAASPKFLFGESYGTTRSAVLAKALETAGVRLSGVVLLSSVLNYNTNCGLGFTITVTCAGYFPSYGAIGAWHQRTNPAVPVSGLPAFAQQLRDIANVSYEPASTAFIATRAVPDPATLQTFTNVTGITVADWQSQLNLAPDGFRVRLLPGFVLGRYDARMSVPGNSPGIDISNTFISTSFAVGLQGYMTDTLRFTNPSVYTFSSGAINTWDFSHDGNGLPDVVPDLLAALTLNPRLQVLAVSGYHDLATPWFQTERDIARMGGHPNVRVRNYSGGHMIYLDNASRIAQKADLAEFYRTATQP